MRIGSIVVSRIAVIACALALVAAAQVVSAQTDRARASKPDVVQPNARGAKEGRGARPAAAPPVQGGGTATARQTDPAFEPATSAELQKGYPLGTGDVVRVVIFQQPAMTTETRVSESGTITIPMLGPVPVGNVTPKRAEARVGALLRARGLVQDPQVVVTVLEFKSRSVSILGLVHRPGRYNLEEGMYRLSDVLALAGGPMPDSADVVTLVRQREGSGGRYEIDIPSLYRSGDFSKNPEVIAGDSIYVDRAAMFYIYGEVMKPGAFRLEKDITVMQALALGGGLTPRGTEKNLQIRRRDPQGRYVFVKSGLSDVLQPNDVVFVRESLF